MYIVIISLDESRGYIGFDHVTLQLSQIFTVIGSNAKKYVK